MSPENGLLAGKIIRIGSDQRIELEDLKGNIWNIQITDAIWRGRMSPSKNLIIKIIGQATGDNQFVAKEIRPWKGKRHRGKRRGMRIDSDRE